jgi:hypothetical protein
VGGEAAGGRGKGTPPFSGGRIAACDHSPRVGGMLAEGGHLMHGAAAARAGALVGREDTASKALLGRLRGGGQDGVRSLGMCQRAVVTGWKETWTGARRGLAAGAPRQARRGEPIGRWLGGSPGGDGGCCQQPMRAGWGQELGDGAERLRGKRHSAVARHVSACTYAAVAALCRELYLYHYIVTSAQG